MPQRDKIATVFGGTGFVGRQVVRELAKCGVTIKVATRVPESAYFLKPCGVVGQVVPFQCNYDDAHSIREAVRGADYVVNCIGILYEKGKRSTFQRAHVDVPAIIAKACADENVKKFVHISALGCDSGTSKYAQTKYEGEKAVLSNFKRVAILRPSIIFGPDDNFFNMFAEIARFVPMLPLIGGGKTRFQPVYVGDIADVVLKIVFSQSAEHRGKVYQLGGPDVVTFKMLYEKIFKYTGRPRPMVPLPYWLAKFESFFLSLWPRPILTPDQVESLKTDSVVEEGALGMNIFGIKPKSMDLIVPGYLDRYKSGGRFGGQKSA